MYVKKIHKGGRLIWDHRAKARGMGNIPRDRSQSGTEPRSSKGNLKRKRRIERPIAAGYIPRQKRRPRKEAASEEEIRNNEIAQLRMQVELLQNFLSKAGRRRS